MSDRIIISQEEIDRAKKKHNIIDITECKLVIKKMTEYKSKIQPWFWAGMIPDQTLTLFGGQGGIGKSLLLLYIAAKTSTGEMFKAGGLDHQLKKGSVILLSAEDDPECQIKPKLEACGADLDKVYHLMVKENVQTKEEEFLGLDVDLFRLEKAIKEIGDVKLIVIDPITYFTGAIKDHISGEVANFLHRLMKIAKKYDLAIILNKHLRKQGSGAKGVANAASEIGGAGAWTNTPRKCWLITNHHEDTDVKVITQMKDNLSKNSSDSLAYKIVPATVYEDGLQIKTTRLQWLDQLVNMTAAEAIDQTTYEKGKFEQTIDLILSYLKDNGQSLVKNISIFCQSHGISDITFRRSCAEFEQRYKDILKIERGMKNSKMYRLVEE